MNKLFSWLFTKHYFGYVIGNLTNFSLLFIPLVFVISVIVYLLAACF